MFSSKKSNLILKLMDVSLLFVASFSVFLLVSLLTYSSSDSGYLAINSNVLTNYFGLLGSYVAGFLFYYFGNFAYFVPFLLLYCLYLTLNCFLFDFKINPLIFLGKILGLCFFVYSLCVFFNIFNFIDNSYHRGGLLGYELSVLIEGLFGTKGSLLFLAANFFIVSLVLLFDFSLINKFNNCFSFLFTQTGALLTRLKCFFVDIGCFIIKKNQYDLDAYVAREKIKVFDSKLVMQRSTEQKPTEQKPTEQDYLFCNFNKILPKISKNVIASNCDKQDIKSVNEEQQALILQNRLLEIGLKVKVNLIAKGYLLTLFKLTDFQKDQPLDDLLEFLSTGFVFDKVRVFKLPEDNSVILELPNLHAEHISFDKLIKSKSFFNHRVFLSYLLGVDTQGDALFSDFTKTPNLFLAGGKGSGKSFFIKNFIASLICKHKPDNLQLILVDIKSKLNLSVYNGISHLVFDTITNFDKSLNVFNWCSHEIVRRRKMLKDMNVDDVISYNKKVAAYNSNVNSDLISLPKIAGVVVVVYGFDMILKEFPVLSGKMIDILQKSSSLGIHFVLSVSDVIESKALNSIKNCIPDIIAFHVSSAAKSKAIIGQDGAEVLLGSGDMLIFNSDSNVISRAHSAAVDDKFISEIVNYWRNYENKKSLTCDHV